MIADKETAAWEWCHHCGAETLIPHEVSQCHSCGRWLVPCAMCEHTASCDACSFSKKAAELNNSDGANDTISPGIATSDSSDPGEKPLTGEEFCVKDLPGLFQGHRDIVASYNTAVATKYESYLQKLSIHVEVLEIILKDLKLLDDRVVSTPRLDRAIAALERALGVV